MAEKKVRGAGFHLVMGAGIAGIKAALDMAETGRHVYLVERRPNVGGTLSQLDKQFPNNHCGMCRALPGLSGERVPQFCLRREMAHPNVTLLTGTDVVGLEGEAPDFEARVKVRFTGVDGERCISCNRCMDACPVEVDDEFCEGLSKRKAIFVRHRLAVPNVPAVDFDACTKCGRCVEACPVDCIELEGRDEERTLAVSSVVVSAGFEEFAPAAMGQYGHGRYANVLSGIEFERSLSQLTPEGGSLRRPSDGKAPRKIAFLQCVGSRDTEAPYCSSACCMFAMKEALMAVELDPAVEPVIFFMDVRAFGKGYHRYYERAREKVRFVRSRVAALRADPATDDVLLFSRSADGKNVEERFDLAVLATGFRPPPGSSDLLDALGLDAGDHGFVRSRPFDPVRTSRDGVYACGPFAEPKDIPDTMVQASAAAALAMTHSRPAPDPAGEGACGPEPKAQDAPRVALVLCECGGEIAGAVDLDALAKRLAAGFSLVERVPLLCREGTLEDVAARLARSEANRVVFAACVPYRYTALFRRAARSAGIPSNFVEVVNVREHAAWVHDDPADALEKAASMVRMAAGRLRLEQPLVSVSSDVSARVAVLGGGVAGMTAALTLADLGFQSDLVERSDALGGLARNLSLSASGPDPASFLAALVERVKASTAIRPWLATELADLEGTAGSFTLRLVREGGTEETLEAGAVVVATGARDLDPGAYLCGEHPRVMVRNEFDALLARDGVKEAPCVAAILCAGVREGERNYCSRTCCADLCASIVALKEKHPDASVTVFYRDVMTYGFHEDLYRRARHLGAVFVRYEPGAKPAVRAEGDHLVVEGQDTVLGARLAIRADYVVLNSAFAPADNAPLARLLGVEVDEDGFFQEADVKFRPVDFITEGLFVAGLASAPRGLAEVVTQGRAAAGRAAALLTRGTVESVTYAVAEVEDRRCSGCEVCAAACEYGARVIDPETGVMAVRQALCTGCGACAAACPNAAAQVASFREKQVIDMIDAALGL